MKENPTYELRTLKEILDVVNNDNIENFLADFNEWLLFALSTRNVSEILKEGNIGYIDQSDVSFKWTDDGKSGLTKITIEITQEETPNK